MVNKFKKIMIGAIGAMILAAPAIKPLTVLAGTDLSPSQVPSTVFSRNAATGGKVIISWKIPADSDLAAFKIYRSNTSGCTGDLIATVSADTSSYQDSGIYNGETYYYTVSSLDNANNEAFAKQISSTPSYDENSMLYPEKTLLRFEGRSTVYKTDSGGRTLRAVSKMVFDINKYSFNDVLTIPIAWQDSFRYGGSDTYRDGTLIRAAGQETVYIIENGLKRPFSSKAIFDALGYSFDNVNEVPLTGSASTDAIDGYATGDPIVSYGTHTSGTLVKTSGDDTVYLIQSGQKKPIGSVSVFLSYNFDFDDVVEVSVSELNGYQTGSVLKFMDGTLVKGTADAIYAINDSSSERIPFRSMIEFAGLGYSLSNVVSISDSELSSKYILASPFPV